MAYTREHWERIYMLALCRDIFLDGKEVCEKVLAIARTMNRDRDVDKVRAFAASGGDTISYDAALSVVRDIAQRRALD